MIIRTCWADRRITIGSVELGLHRVGPTPVAFDDIAARRTDFAGSKK